MTSSRNLSSFSAQGTSAMRTWTAGRPLGWGASSATITSGASNRSTASSVIVSEMLPKWAKSRSKINYLKGGGVRFRPPADNTCTPAEWTRAWAAKSLSEWTSKSRGWKRSSRAAGLSSGSLCRHLQNKRTGINII